MYLFIFCIFFFIFIYIYCRTVQSSYILQKGEHLQSAPACGTHSIGRVRKMCSLTTDCVVILHPIFYRKRTLAVSTCLRNTFYSERTHSIGHILQQENTFYWTHSTAREHIRHSLIRCALTNSLTIVREHLL